MLVHANISNSEIEPFIAVKRDNFQHEILVNFDFGIWANWVILAILAISSIWLILEILAILDCFFAILQFGLVLVIRRSFW